MLRGTNWPGGTARPRQSGQSGATWGILLVDDHPVVRQGLALLLQGLPACKLVGQAKDGREALEKAKLLNPDVILMDIDLPRLDGFSATQILRQQQPQSKVILVSGLPFKRLVPRILESGARGFLCKEASATELFQAVKAVAEGGTYFDPEIARLALQYFAGTQAGGSAAARLTAREREVLALVAEGLSNKEVACRLGLGTRTAESHRERIMHKLNLHSAAELTRFAVANGLAWIAEDSGERTEC